MSKKVPVQLYLGLAGLAIGLGSLVGSQNTWAENVTFSRLEAAYQWLLDDAEKECNNYVYCENYYFKSRIEFDSWGRMYKTFSDRPLIMTSFNPSTKKVKYYYNDRTTYYVVNGLASGQERPILKELGFYMASPQGQISRTLELYRFDASTIQPRQETEFIYEPANQFDGPLFPWVGCEVVAKNFNFTSDTYEYDDCLSSPDYREGMDCRIAFNVETGKYFYAPAEPGQEPVFKDESSVLPDNDPQDTPRTDSGVSETNPQDDLASGDNSTPVLSGSPEGAGQGSASQGTVASISETSSASLPGAPNAGALNTNSKFIALLGFMFLLALISLLVILSRFIKIPKNLKKTLDIRTKVR